jgi:hypothetical protein
MSDRRKFRRARTYSCALALFAGLLLQAATPLFAAAMGPPGEIAGNPAGTLSERRCEWTPKKEHCYWVKRDSKLVTRH